MKAAKQEAPATPAKPLAVELADIHDKLTLRLEKARGVLMLVIEHGTGPKPEGREDEPRELTCLVDDAMCALYVVEDFLQECGNLAREGFDKAFAALK